MNILFDINHPAHIHLFRNAIKSLKENGHKAIITSRDKDITLDLLDRYGIEHIVLSKAQKGLLGLGIELIWRQIRLLPILLKNKINICVSVTGACNVHICKLLGIPTLVFYDTEHASLQNKLTLPFVTKFITPDSFQGRYGKNHTTYNGTHDIAYLHPKYFTPDPNIFDLLKISADDKFFILRFVSWQAAHDIGKKGSSLELKRKLIDVCSKYGKVFITSEAKIDAEFQKYSIAIPPEKMHDALYFATMYIGEGGSMATEAAILGTPAILVNSLTAGVFDELENQYRMLLTFCPSDEDKIIKTAQNLLNNENLKHEWLEKKDRFINDKIDLTEYMLETILRYDKSPSTT